MASGSSDARSLEDTLPVWRKIYQVISDSVTHIPLDIVEETICICKKKLVEGLLEFTPYSPESLDKWKKQLANTPLPNDPLMCSFVHKLSVELDLDVTVAWSVICNFLLFEYYGKVDELMLIIRYETDMKVMIDHVWQFYSADRMFLLKTLRFIIEKWCDKDYIYYNLIKNFFYDIDVDKFWKNLLKIYKGLLLEIRTDKAKMISNDILEQWIHRGNREKVEVLMLMIRTIRYIELDGTEFEEMIRIFMIHGFTRYPVYSGSLQKCRPSDLFDIKSAEMGAILVMANRYKVELSVYMLSNDLLKSLEYHELHTSQCHGCLLIWIILKYNISMDMTYFRDTLNSLLSKKIFKSISDMVCNPIFDDCKEGLIVVESAYGLLVRFFDIVEDYSHMFEEEGVVALICKFFKHPKLDALELLGPLFDFALEMFPCILEPFLDMCLALMHNERYFSGTLAKLRYIPTFCSGHSYGFHDETMTTKGTQQLFRGSDLFIIPPNTVTYKTTCFGESYCRFELPFDFFVLVEQYIKSFVFLTLDLNQLCKKTLSYLTGSYKFLIELVKLYKGDLNNDPDIAMLIRRLDCIPAYFSVGDFQDFNFFKLYFEANVTMVIYGKLDYREAFPLLISKRVLPQITDLENVNQECTSVHTNSACLLYKFLKIEETSHDHSLLLLYINLIGYITEKNEYHKEVQIPGFWYLLNVIFPLHRQWMYDDPHQEVLVLRGCLKTFIKVLQRYSPEHQPTRGSDKILFEMCMQGFMHDKWLVTGLWSILTKNRYTLDPLMQQDTNWLKGKSQDNLECIRYELVLILLLFKHRPHLRNIKWCNFDERSSSIAKSVSAQLVNPYSSIIGILALKVLNALAKNDHIPLLASLGLDHDQVQRLFLDRLREPMEDQDLKLNVLEFIITCIKYQHAMTAAFFNIHCSKKWYTDYKSKVLEGDTMEDFVVDYIDNIEKTQEYLKNPLQVALLRVIEQLWLCQKQHLVREVASTSRFWNLLIKPLRCILCHTPDVYGHLFKILSIQLTWACREPDGQETFLKAIEEYFVDKQSFNTMRRYLLKGVTIKNLTSTELQGYRLCIRNFSELLMKSEKQNIVKKLPDSETRFYFVDLCLKPIETTFANMEWFEIWTDFCLVIFNTFGLQFEDKNKQVMESLIKMCSIFNIHYQTLNMKCRKGVVSLIHKIVREMQPHLENNSLDLRDLLEQIGSIFDYECKMLMEEVYPVLRHDNNGGKTVLIPWMLWITIANTLLKYKNCEECRLWYGYHHFLKYATDSLLEIVKYKQTLPLGKLIMHTLILYVKSPMASDIFMLDLRHIFDSVEPHITPLLLGRYGRVYPLDLKEGWVWSTLLFQLIDQFMRKFQKRALELSFTFMRLNEKILDHIMFAIECTVDVKALDLTISMLKFFDSILNQWNIEWYRKSNDTYNFMMRHVSKMVNACIYIILRPKSIVMHFIDEYYRIIPLRQSPEGERVSNELMISIMNRLLAILEWSFTCLYKVNPTMLRMLDDFEYQEDTIPLIEDDFSVPKFELPVPYAINYGRLLCLAHFLCKILTQLNPNSQKRPPIDLDKYSSCCALIQHSDESTDPNQKLNSFLRYAMYEYTTIGESWLNHIDAEQLKLATEKLMLFLGQQVFLQVNALHHHSQMLLLYKRNLCSELSFLSDFVKHKSARLLNFGQRPGSASLMLKGEMDIVKSYLIKLKNNGNLYEAADKNFLLVASHWIFNFCQVK